MIAAWSRNVIPPVLLSIIALAVFLGLPECRPIIAQAQGAAQGRQLLTEFVPEEGSPVQVTSSRAELELDPFGAPTASRLYVEYKNVGDRPIAAVKFRIRFGDEDGKDRGTYHAPHAALLAPGQTASEKWRHARVDPRTTQLKIRALMVKYADGTSWQTSRMQQIVTPAVPGEGGAVPGSPSDGGAAPGSE